MSDSGGGAEADGRKRGSTPADAGVLGNLPRTRPAVRSPRRKAAKPWGTEARGSEPAPETATLESRSERGGVEDLEALARAGLSLAGGAATLGLRLAGRAASAARGAVERR